MTLYNHYMRDSNGNYIRVPIENPPVESVHIPQSNEMKKKIQMPQEVAPVSEVSQNPPLSTTANHKASQQRPTEMQLANKLLGRLNLADIDSGDLLLLALLFFLFRQKADEELLIALGLLLVM